MSQSPCSPPVALSGQQPDVSAGLPVQIRCEPFDRVSGEAWNAAIGQAPEARIQQSYQAAQIRFLEGVRPLFLTAYRGGQVVGRLLLFQSFIHPEFLQWCRPLLSTRSCRRWWGVYRWWGGPLIFDKANYAEVLSAFLAFVDDHARQEGVFAVKEVMPPFYDPGFDPEVVDGIYRGLGFDGREQATIALELDELEVLWKQLSRDARQKVQKAEKLGVRILDADTEEGLRRYHGVRLENCRRNGVRGPHLDATLAAKPLYIDHGLGKVFIAEYQGRIVSGQMAVIFNGNVQLAGVCQSDYAYTQGVPANDLMQWHVITWARAQGYRRVDWAGFTPDPQSEKAAGINRFKAKWGGRVRPYFTYSKVYGQRRQRLLESLKGLARAWGIR